MMVEHDVAQLFGLSGTFPRPGWVVLDAARDHRFTGELLFETSPPVRVHFDRGRIYLAERTTDPSLGSRLVDAGALSAAQLEHGSLRLGDVEHLGRLFDRVPGLDRDAVLVTKELLSDECLSWLAAQQVPAVEQTPYRHHPSGIHHWDRPDDALDLTPGDPLPAPSPGDAPLAAAPPGPLFELEEPIGDDVIRWDEPSWLDEPHAREGNGHVDPFTPSDLGAASPTPQEAPAPAPGPAPGQSTADWIDRLEVEGLPAAGSDPLARPRKLPPLPVEPIDRFEVIWPSGEVDEQFGATDVATIEDRHPDLDRRGPTARVASASPQQPVAAPPEPAADRHAADHPAESGAPTGAVPAEDAGAPHEEGDEVVLAVRRAVASIETGALAARRRLSEQSPDDTSRGMDPMPPGRVALRDESGEWTVGGTTGSAARSVFDEPVVTPPADPAEVDEAPADEAADGQRHSALRRLIGSLRRR